MTTVTATARVSIVHGTTCTVLADDPRYQRRRKRGEEGGKEGRDGGLKLECIESGDGDQRKGEESDGHGDSTV